MNGQTYSVLQTRDYTSLDPFLRHVSEAEAEAAARELWSDWDRMDDEERRVLLLEVHRAFGAVAECRGRAKPKSVS